jgi:hypothetical protein
MRAALLLMLCLLAASCGHGYQPPGQDLWRMVK